LIHRIFTESSQASLFDLEAFTESRKAPFFNLQGFYRVKPGPLFGFTGFLQSQARPPFSINRVFTGSSQAPFFDLQGFYSKKPIFTCYLQVFYRVKPGTLFGFTGFLKGQARPPFSIYRVSTTISQYLHVIYRFFTESSQAPFLDLQGFYRVKPGPLSGFTGFLQSQARPPFSIYRVFTDSS